MKVVVVGLGYVGAVTAACLATNGHNVWGLDVDPAKVADIRAGRSPVAEPGLGALVARAVDAGTLHVTGSYAEALDLADMSVVCVGTPSGPRGGTDLSFLRRAINEIVTALRSGRPALRGHYVLIRSTVPPGTLDDVVWPTLTAGLEGAGLEVGTGVCPEFLREGSGVADFGSPPLLVVGTSDQRVADAVTELFGFLDRPVQIVGARVAEALKYACNAFHATKVSFANEIGRLLRPLEVDSRQVMSLLCQDHVLNISPSYLRPGFAFGGSCLPKDLRSLLHLARLNGADLPLLSATLASNELSINEVVDRVIACDVHAVALFGLSFKMSTDDLRESPAVELAERLVGKGYDVRIYDQVVHPASLLGANRRYVDAKLPHLERLLVRDAQDALCGADAAVVSACDPEVVGALLRSPPRHVIDVCGQLGAHAESLPGYQGIGW